MTAMSETPRTDKMTYETVGRFSRRRKLVVPAAFSKVLERELNDLTRWKAKALEVERSWDPQAVGKLLGMTIGTPIHQNIQPAIEKLLARLAAERALADRLALILDDIRYYDDLSPDARQPVTEALAAWKEARSE